MELKQLEYFTAIVEHGSISAAAKQLHISQPPLSMQMKHLEEELNSRLFERGARSITLTEAGKILYERSKGILEMASVTVRELEQMKDGISGTLRLGMISSAGLSCVKQTLLPFHSGYPGIRLDICEGNTYQLMEALKNNRIEIAIVRTPFPEEGYECRHFEEDAMTAVGLSHYFGNHKSNSLSIKDMERFPLIIYRRWESILRHAFGEEETDMNIFCINDDARTSIKLAAAGLGVALVPASAVEGATSEGMTVKYIDNARLKSSLTIIHKKKDKLSGPGDLFFKYILKE